MTYTNGNNNGNGDQGITLAFRVPSSMAVAIDVAANAQNKNRSQFLRNAVESALANHAAALDVPPEGATVYENNVPVAV